jgi:hypothetical protein
MSETSKQGLAAAVYRVLVEECDAPTDDMGFGSHWPECREWRFQGNQGFGGKVWWDGRRAYVTCYQEDDNPQRKAARDAANVRLAALDAD